MVDWTTAPARAGRAGRRAQLPDSLPYRGLADSSGRFSLGPLPAGRVRRERRAGREPEPSRRIRARPSTACGSRAGDDSALELWAFVHDTAPPRIRTVTPADSVSASVEFAQPLDPRQRLQPSAVRAVAAARLHAGAGRVGAAQAGGRQPPRAARRRSRIPPAADTTAARHDAGRPRTRRRTTARRPAAGDGRSPAGRRSPTSSCCGRPRPGGRARRYTVEIRGVRNVTGVAGDVVGTLVDSGAPRARYARAASRLAEAGRRHDPRRRRRLGQARSGQAGSDQARSRPKPAADQAGARPSRRRPRPSERPAARASLGGPAAARAGDPGAAPHRAAHRGGGRGARVARRRAHAARRSARELGGRRARAARRPRRAPSLRPVLNATGVVLHTNLGRAPLAPAAVAAMVAVAAGYSNLEFDLDTGQPRQPERPLPRARFAPRPGPRTRWWSTTPRARCCSRCGALAAGREVLISRGELIEIGGSFRIPDILARSGARLREVGTTNRTHLDDYRKALGPDVGGGAHGASLQLRAARASSPRPSPAISRRSAARPGIPYLVDVGSGLLADLVAVGPAAASRGCRTRWPPAPDLVLFSGDKLLGGPQAGCLVGAGGRVARCREHPIARAVRADKMTLAGAGGHARALPRSRGRRCARSRCSAC